MLWSVEPAASLMALPFHCGRGRCSSRVVGGSAATCDSTDSPAVRPVQASPPVVSLADENADRGVLRAVRQLPDGPSPTQAVAGEVGLGVPLLHLALRRGPAPCGEGSADLGERLGERFR